MDTHTGGALLDECGRTDIPGIYACGNAAHVYDIVDQLTHDARLAGKAAADYINNKSESDFSVQLTAGCGIKYVVPQRLSYAGRHTLSFRVSAPGENKHIRIRKKRKILVEKFISRVNPPELIRLNVQLDQITNGDIISLEVR